MLPWGLGLLYALPVLFLVLFFLVPLAAILQQSFAAGLGGTLATLGDGYYWRVLAFTTWQAALSTGLTLLVALPGAYVFARYDFPGKSLLRALAGMPFVLPTVVVAVAFGALLGPRGLLAEAVAPLGWQLPRLTGGLGIVLLAHVFYNYTVVLRLVGGFWQGLDPQLEQAAATLGVSRWRTFWRVTLPLLWPAIAAAGLLVFIFCFTSFGVIVILGGARMATLEVEIYRQTAQLLRLEVAATLALIQALCTLALSLFYTRLAGRVAVPLGLLPRQATARRPQGLANWLLVLGNAGVILLLLGAPLAALVVRSVWLPGPDGPSLSLAAYTNLGQNRTGSAFFVAPSQAIFNSLRIASTTMILALALGVPAAYLLAATRQGQLRQRLLGLLDALFMLPLGTSAVTLGLGYVVALGALGLGGWRASPWLLPLAHTLVALPFVIRVLLPALRARSPRQHEAAAVLGAGPVATWWRVELPQLAPALTTAAVFAFTVSLGEFGASLLLARPDTPTLPVLIFRLLGQPGALSYGQALALSVILMLVSAFSFGLLERVRPRGGEV
ncbi:MAG: ABC transporter permease [Oscillochloridaceae bacterium umkhey_bin13]